MDTVEYSADDEIDLFELFSSLCQQWRWLVGITLLGTVMAVAVALMLPKQYEVTTQIALPDVADVMAIDVNGYGEYSRGSLFNELYKNLRSPVQLDAFLIEGKWGQALSQDAINEMTNNEVLAKVLDTFAVEVLEPKKNKGEENTPAPQLLSLTMWHTEEQVAADLLNEYVEKTNQNLIASLAKSGKKRRALEVEKIEKEAALLKNNARTVRELTIEKLEEQNQVKIKTLLQSIELLIKKAKLDEASELAKLNEALKLAVDLKIKNPTTIDALPKSNVQGVGTAVNVTTDRVLHLFLMGSDYLNGVIENFSSRQKKELFIPEISKLKKQIGMVENDQTLAALKAKKNDDPYIAELPPLLKKLDRLSKLSFDFTGVQLYKLDKQAAVDGRAEKPKRALIVAVGAVLSGFVAIFVALIVGAVKRRRELVL